jgi:hypothetical protein
MSDGGLGELLLATCYTRSFECHEYCDAPERPAIQFVLYKFL